MQRHRSLGWRRPRCPGPTSSEPTNFQGTVSGNEIRAEAAHGSGSLTVKGDEMTGMVYGIMPATVSLKRQR